MFWSGSSNLEGGLLIDLGNLSGIEVDEGKTTVKLGPAILWGPLYKTLSSVNVYVAGGRLPVVGAGGFLMHGGHNYPLILNIHSSCFDCRGHQLLVLRTWILQ